MTRCDSEALSLFLDGALSVREHRLVAEHLRDCRRCRHELASLRGVDELIAAWGRRNVPIPPATEARVQRSLEKHGRMRPLLALSRMMPAALGTSVAALLVLVTTNLAPLYHGGAATSPGPAHIVASKALRDQSAPLRFQRGKSAIVSTYTAPPPPVVDGHAQLEIY